MEPPCICTRLTPPNISELRSLQDRYTSSVTRRREYCEPSRCHARVGTSLKSEFDSRSYGVDRIVNKIQELRRNVQDVDELQRHDKTKKMQRERPHESSSNAEITDVKAAHRAVENCLREMAKVKAFLEDDNSWWKILKSRSFDCCEQKIPHLHGLLDGSSVTLMLLEEEADEVPRRFITSTPKKRNDIADFSFRKTSSKDSTGEMSYVEQDTDQSKEDTEERTVSCYSIDMKSALIEVASIDGHNPTQEYVKRNARSKQSTVPSEFLTEAREDRNIEKIPVWSSRSKDAMQYGNKEKRTDRSNVVPPREIWYRQNTQTMPEDMLRPREIFSSENTGGIKHFDFESNVDLSTELPSRNIASHKPRSKPIAERCVQHTQKLLSKISRTRSRE